VIRCSKYLLIPLTLTLGCLPKEVTPPEFDGVRAYGYLVRQVEFGPRVAGTEASRACREYFYEHFRSLNMQVDSQCTTFFDPYSKTDSPLVNVIARFRGDAEDSLALILMAHYDSRPRTDYAIDTTKRNQPIDGANDGASGVAVLMELANMLAAKPPRSNVDIVLVDGEDWGKPIDHDYYLLGSRFFARSGIRGKYYFGIVIDMIGDSKQEIFRETYSQTYNLKLNDFVWNTAAELGVVSFHDSVKHTVIDDHLPLNVAGVPTILIIDFDYPFWHTELDTPDRCSAQSLANVGQVLAKIVYTPSSWPELR